MTKQIELYSRKCYTISILIYTKMYTDCFAVCNKFIYFAVKYKSRILNYTLKRREMTILRHSHWLSVRTTHLI